MIISLLLTLLGIFDVFSDLGFVIKIMVFSYILYWLFMVFREQQVILGLVAIIAAYFMFAHAISVTVLVLLFLVFIVMSGHFQFIIDMGIIPILGWFGYQYHEGVSAEDVQLQEINKKLSEGHSLSSDETDLFRKSQEKQMRYEESAHRLLVNRNVS
ncbi:MAG: hypothetical protein V1644_01435 [Candidatus Micrarchaeota archaeon]